MIYIEILSISQANLVRKNAIIQIAIQLHAILMQSNQEIVHTGVLLKTKPALSAKHVDLQTFSAPSVLSSLKKTVEV